MIQYHPQCCGNTTYHHLIGGNQEKLSSHESLKEDG